MDQTPDKQAATPIPAKKRGNPNFIKGAPSPYLQKLREAKVRQKLEHSHKMTDKQVKYVEAVVLDKVSKVEAMKKAGYAGSVHSDQIEASPIVKAALNDAYAKVGIDASFLANRLQEGALANETRFFSYDGIVTDERTVPDFAVRHKYVNTILETNGLIKGNTIETMNIGIIQTPPQTPEDALKAEFVQSETEQKAI